MPIYKAPTASGSGDMTKAVYDTNNDGIVDSAANGVPSGALFPYGGSAAPTGFLLCDGTSYLRTDYAALFTAIGVAYGSVDGTHFTVPDLRSAFPKGKGGAAALGNVGGAATHTPTGTVSQPTVTMDSYTPSGTNSAPSFAGTASQSTNKTTSGITINNESAHTHTAGTFTAAAQVFTGSALAAHAHELPWQIPSTTTIRQIAVATFGTGTSRAATAVSAAGTANTTSAAVALSQSVSAGTPAGTNASSAVSGTSDAGSAHTHGVTEPNAGTGHLHTFTATGTVTAPTFTGNAATLTGTVSQPTFTGASANTEPAYVVFNYIIKT